jgi:hypothetical protein
MSQVPSERDVVSTQPTSSPYTHVVFPQRALYTVPEHEMESPAGPTAAPCSSAVVPDPGAIPMSQLVYIRESSFSSTRSQGYGPEAWYPQKMQRHENWNRHHQAGRWMTPVRIALNIGTLMASVAIVGLLAQALVLHQKLRHVRQFSGTDDAWPKHLSLSASIFLLSSASMNIVKSATFLVIEVHRKNRTHNNRFLVICTSCSALMAAIWIAASVFAEVNKKSEGSFAVWACARSDAVFNLIVPYGQICNEEVG